MPKETETVFSGFPTGKKDKEGKTIYRDVRSVYHTDGSITYNPGGGSRKSRRNARGRRNSKKQKRVRHTRRKQTRRHRHRHSRRH